MAFDGDSDRVPATDPSPRGSGPERAWERHAEEALRRAHDLMAPATGRDYFRSLVDRLCLEWGVDYAFVGKIVNAEAPAVESVAASHGGASIDNFSYTLDHTPCENVVGESLCYYPEGVQQAFPNDLLLQEMNILSYMGAPLRGSTGKTLGILVLLSESPMEDAALLEATLRIVAGRTAAELERELTVDALRRSERFIQAITAASPHVMYLFNRMTMKIVWSNRRIYADLGYSRNEAREMGDSFLERVIHPDDFTRLPSLLARWDQGQDDEVLDVEYRMRHRDGSWRWFLGHDTVFSRAADGTVELLVGITQDVTDRKRADEEHRKLEDQMRHAQKLESLGVMAGGLAHDFNNLLTSILGFANLASSELPADSPAFAMLAEIERAALQGSGLTRQLLAYSGRGQLVNDVFDLGATVDEMRPLLRTLLSKKTEIQYELGNVNVAGDGSQIRQILLNLTSNASESLEDRPGTVGIRTGLRFVDAAALESPFFDYRLPEGDYAFLEVWDTGCGMDEETARSMFDPFFTTKFLGRGLGLAAVLGIVRSHGGTLQVRTNPGAGTSFTVFLPISASASIARETAGIVRTPLSPRGVVLVVDDEAMIRLFCRRALEKKGFEVMEAADGQDGVEVFDRHCDVISAVVLDLTMPKMDGWEAMAEIYKRNPDIPVLLISGFTDPAVPPEIGAAHAPRVLQKPFRSNELIAEVSQLMA